MKVVLLMRMKEGAIMRLLGAVVGRAGEWVLMERSARCVTV